MRNVLSPPPFPPVHSGSPISNTCARDSPFISYIPHGAWYRPEFRTRSVSTVTNIRVISTIKMNISRVHAECGFRDGSFPAGKLPHDFFLPLRASKLRVYCCFTFSPSSNFSFFLYRILSANPPRRHREETIRDDYRSITWFHYNRRHGFSLFESR